MKLQLLSFLQLVYAHSSITSSIKDDKSCTYDPFYHLRPSPLPICSLTLDRASDTPTELLSFEEWKQAQLQSQRTTNYSKNTSRQQRDESSGEQNSLAPGSSTSQGAGNPREPLSDDSRREFRVPLTDRFNYASQDCTARIHSSHKGAKSPSSVLSSKKDRYMLSPCGAKEKYVVVELCDDVRIDTVQLANYEFFSGVFKDIKISLSEHAPGDRESWIDAGTYKAKNNRGVQSFHPVEGRRQFYRYIRIDFLSHYGNEYYCPMSLLRVYGLTHMEDYKWAGWQTGDELPVRMSMSQEAPAAVKHDAEGLKENTMELGQIADNLSTPLNLETAATRTEAPTIPTAVLAIPETPDVPDPLPTITMSAEGDDGAQSGYSDNEVATPVRYRTVQGPEPAAASLIATSVQNASDLPDDAVTPGSITLSSSSSEVHTYINRSVAEPSYTSVSEGTLDIVTKVSKEQTQTAVAARPSGSSPVQLSGNNGGSGGENIFRTIMNRLHILETNSTLAMRYVEEQTRSVRQVVQKLEEDVGRLQFLGKSQQRLLERVVVEMEQQRKDTDAEFRKISMDMQSLAREVTLEKRLGFLQLCLLIFLFVFMALTRGSRESGILTSSKMRSIGSWPSGDWPRWRRAISLSISEGGTGVDRTPEPSPVSPTTGSVMPTPSRRPSQSQQDPFEPAPFPSGPSRSPQYPTSLSPVRTTGYRLPKQAGGRPRVTSTPSLPRHRIAFSRKNTSHLHEVKTEATTYRRDGQQEFPRPQDPTEMGSPRLRRALTSGAVSTSPGAAGLPLRRPSPLGKTKDRADVEGHEHRGRSTSGSENEENSPRLRRERSRTLTPPAEESSPDSGVWEDTSTEAEDDGPSPDKSRRRESLSPSGEGARSRPAMGSRTSFVLSHPLKAKLKLGHRPSLSQETVRVRS